MPKITIETDPEKTHIEVKEISFSRIVLELNGNRIEIEDFISFRVVLRAVLRKLRW